MKRKLVSLLLAASLVVMTLTGCSGDNSNDADTSTTSKDSTEQTEADTDATDSDDSSATNSNLTTDNITLKVWESTEGPDKFIEQAGEAFAELYPNITIEFVNVELGDSSGQIALDGPAGVGADLFAAPHDKLGELVSGGHVLPTVDADTVSAEVLAACQQALTYDGTMYGYPVSAETYALFYNKDLIAEEDVPTTFEDVATYAAENTSGDNYGFLMDVGNIYYSIIFTTSDDNRLFGPDGTDTSNTNINSEASVKGMEFFHSLRESIDVPATDLTTSVCDSAFASGNAAMFITGLWNVTVFEDAGVDFGVTTLPSLPGNDTPAASFSGTRAMFVSAYSDYPEEAAAFAEFLLTEEMQQLRFELTGSLPSIECEVDSPYVSGFLAQLDYAFPMPSVPQMTAFWDTMNAASANIWDGADVQTELDAANTAILAQ